MNYLERLDLRPDVQSFFLRYAIVENDEIHFRYGAEHEHAGPGFHRIPITETHWQAGDPLLASHIVVSSSAMDAIAWLHHQPAGDFNAFFFVALGAVPCQGQAAVIQQLAPNKKIHFLFSKDAPGALCDLKLAAYLHNLPLHIRYSNHIYQIEFRNRSYELSYLSLSKLEKASNYSFRIRTHKPKTHSTYYEQLRDRYQP